MTGFDRYGTPGLALPAYVTTDAAMLSSVNHTAAGPSLLVIETAATLIAVVLAFSWPLAGWGGFRA